MYNKILVPLAPRKETEQALEPALEMAKKHEAEVHFLQVRSIVQTGDLPVNAQKYMNDEKARGQDHLEECSEAFRKAGLQTECSVVLDHEPASRIIDYTNKNGIDLIIIASHGRSGVSRLFLGSTTEHVLRGVDRSQVLVVPIEEEPNTNDEEE